MSKIWNQCKAHLKKTQTLQVFSIWINKIQAEQVGNNLSLITPNEAVQNYIKNNLQKEIIKNIKNIDNSIIVTIIQKENSSQKPKKYTTNLNKDFSFENMVEGDANLFALATGKQIANNLEKPTYNPFIIYGESGLGKTHLMQAIGNHALKQNPRLKIIYMPLLDFVKNITSGLRHKNIEDIKNYYQGADLLLVDDIHLIAGKTKSQEEFFHIFNFLFNIKKQIIFTCDQIPKNIESIENRLKTRFSAGLPVEIQPPELEMRAAILIYKASNIKINIKLGEEVALYIASNIKSNVRDLEGALLKLKAFVDFSGLSHKQVDKNLVDTALSDLISPKKTTVDIFDIQKETSIKYGITNSELISKSRKQNLVLARQTAIYLSCELTTLSLAKIGKNFGNKDHSTILYSYNKFKKIMDEKSDVKQIYENILLKLLTN